MVRINSTLKTALVTLACTVVGGGALMAALSAWFIYGPGASSSGDKTQSPSTSIGGLRAPEIGETMFVGKTNCDKAVKNILRDPGSYEHISAQIVDVKPGEGWVAQVDFRARNGFGGNDSGTAYCVFDGRQYRALLDE
jgi:hypothetical protein